jgi:hypothetical protein
MNAIPIKQSKQQQETKVESEKEDEAKKAMVKQ